MISKELAEELNEAYKNKAPKEVLSYFLKAFKDKIALASSLSLEDQVLTDMIVRIDPQTRIFTLDTGRLFPETYSLIDKTNRKYNIRMEVYFPDPARVEQLVRQQGVNGFYDTIDQRKACCQVRKLEPLKRAFRGLEVWICGLRQSQSVTRQALRIVEWDEKNQLVKLNSLAFFTDEQIKKQIRERAIPYNPLHDKGFPSIGCQPCTRAIQPDEDIRAGRWWWENPEHKECGLHR